MIKLRSCLLVVVLVFSSSPALSANPASLIQAKNLKELELIEASILKKNVYGAACNWETREGQTPSHCFLGVKDEEKRRALLRQCLDRTMRSKNILLLRSKLQVFEQPKRCRDEIAKQIKILEYQKAPLKSAF